MSLFAWRPEYSVHDEELDNHHQQLFTILNSIYEHVMSSEQLDNISATIDELSNYTTYHFTSEEQVMQDKQFPDMAAHIAKHREFTNKISQLRENYHHNDLEVAKDLIIVLGEWLLQHVLKEDKKYSATA